MAEFILSVCKNEKSDMVAESQAIMGLQPAEIYKDPDLIAKLAVIIKEQRGQQFCMLPFCHTLEAEVLGGNINLGDETAGARAGAPICEELSEVLNLEPVPEKMERHDNMLKAVKILKDQGEQVMFCITGPIGTLTCLADSRKIFKEQRRNPEGFDAVLKHLSKVLIDLAKEAAEAGVDAIEYADPPAAVSIVGPKFATEMAEKFTLGFVEEMAKTLGSDTPIYLCPLSATKDMKLDERLKIIAKCPKAIKTMSV